MQVRLSLIVGDFIQSARNAGQSISGIAGAAAKPMTALEGLKVVGADLGRTLVTSAGIGAAAMAGWTANAFAAGAAYNSLQQTAGSALETLMGSAEAAAAQMEHLTTFTRTSPFPRQMWIQAQQTLIGFGVEAERIVPIFEALQDGVVAVGGNAQQIEEVVHILAQMTTTGRVTADELNELAYRGINAAELVGEAWGMSASQLRDSVSQGATDATAFVDTLVSQMSERYGGAAEGLRTTWVGALDRIAGATRDVGSVLAEPFIDPAGGGAAVQWANDVADALRGFEAALRPAVEVLANRAEPAFQAASNAMQQFTETLGDFNLLGFIDSIGEGGAALAGFGAAAAAAGSASVLSAVGLQSLAGAINPLTAGLIVAATVSPQMRDALMGLAQAVGPLVPDLLNLAVQVSSVASAGVGMAGSLLSAAVPAISLFVDLITPVVQVVGFFAEGLSEVPTPALMAGVAIAGVGLAIRALVAQVRTFGAISLYAQLIQLASAAGKARFALAGVVGGVILVGADLLASALGGAADELERVQSVDVGGLQRDLEHLMDTGDATGGLKQLFGEGAEGADQFKDSLDVATASWWSWSDSMNRSFDEMDAADQRFQSLDSAMAQLVAQGKDADAVMRHVAAAYNLTEEQVESLLGLLPQYTAEADRQKNANQDAADAAGEYEDGLEGVEEQAESTRMSLKDLADEMRAQTDPVFAAIKASQDLVEAQEAHNEVLEKYGEGSKEAQKSLVDLLEAKSRDIAASAELAELTGGKLTPEFLALAEAAGISAEELEWLTGVVDDSQDAHQDYADAYMDVNADLNESDGYRLAKAALVYAGMSESAAHWAISTKKSIDGLIEDGWTYQEAIEEVAKRSGRSTAWIEEQFADAHAAGMEFSGEYPATVTLSGVESVINAAQRVKDMLATIDNTVDIAFRYTSRGNWRDYLPSGGTFVPYSTGGPVGGPIGAGDIVPALLTPGEHVWTRSEVDAAGGHSAMESLRSAVLSGQTSHAQAGPASVSVSGGSAVPAHFTATAFFDLGEGVQRVMDVRFERHDRELTQRARQGAGARR